MTRTQHHVRSVVLAGVVLLSVVAGSVAITGHAHASDNEADRVSFVSETPAAGEGTITVRADISDGADSVAFKVQDADGTSSTAVTVEDNGAKDKATVDNVVVADLNLSEIFDEKPASGTAIVAIDEGGDPFSFEHQTYDTKQEFTIDAHAPNVHVSGDVTSSTQDTVRTTNERQIKLGYTMTDTPQKVESARMEIIGPDGNIVKTFDGIQVGHDRAVQFTVPKYWDAGSYDIRVVATDEVGHTVSDTLEDGLVVEPSSTQISSKNVRVMEDQPVSGSENVTLKIGTAYPGANAAIKVQDAAGTVSERVVVEDGGSADTTSTEGVIVTDVDLGALFDAKPASGTALIGVDHDADPFSFEYQTYDAKRQLDVDADAPTVSVTGASSDEQTQVTGAPGDQVKIRYAITDEPQKIQSAQMRIIDANGTVVKEITGLEAGSNRKVQLTIPSDWADGNYTITVTAIDEVGHSTTGSFENGLVVNSTSSS